MNILNEIINEPIRITSPYGKRVHPITGKDSFHNGVDIAVPIGTQVYAPFDGVIIACVENKVGGRQLVIEDKDRKYRITFSHLLDFVYNSGAFNKGELLCHSGNSGASTGAHLHVTIREHGFLVNPQKVSYDNI